MINGKLLFTIVSSSGSTTGFNAVKTHAVVGTNGDGRADEKLWDEALWIFNDNSNEIWVDSDLANFRTEMLSDFEGSTLFHRRTITRMHVRRVRFFHQLYGLLGLRHRLKRRVCEHRVPVLFRFFPAGMGQYIDESVVRSGGILGYPVTHSLQIVFGE